MQRRFYVINVETQMKDDVWQALKNNIKHKQHRKWFEYLRESRESLKQKRTYTMQKKNNTKVPLVFSH